MHCFYRHQETGKWCHHLETLFGLYLSRIFQNVSQLTAYTSPLHDFDLWSIKLNKNMHKKNQTGHNLVNLRPVTICCLFDELLLDSRLLTLSTAKKPFIKFKIAALEYALQIKIIKNIKTFFYTINSMSFSS